MEIDLGQLWGVAWACLGGAQTSDHLTLHLVHIRPSASRVYFLGFGQAGKGKVAVKPPNVFLEFPVLGWGEALSCEQLFKQGWAGGRGWPHNASLLAAERVCYVVERLVHVFLEAL